VDVMKCNNPTHRIVNVSADFGVTFDAITWQHVLRSAEQHGTRLHWLRVWLHNQTAGFDLLDRSVDVLTNSAQSCLQTDDVLP